VASVPPRLLDHVHDDPPQGAEPVLAAHMLYHVPDPLSAVRELRRITRDGGQVLVILNGEEHLRELRDAVTAALPPSPPGSSAAPGDRLRLDDGARLLAAEFRSVTRHDFTGELLIPSPEPVQAYVRSMTTSQDLPDPDDLAAAVTRLLRRDHPETFTIRTECGCLVCT
jgi:SAM-dependent methyltransferase